MQIQWIVFGAILVISAIAAISIAIYIAINYRMHGHIIMILMLISLAIWSFSYAMITFADSLAAKIFWLRVENLGIQTQPLLWFVYVLNYLRRKSLKWWQGVLLAVIPLASLVMIASNNWFHLYYASVTPIAFGGGPLAIERGPWYWVALLQSYTLNGLATILLIWRFIEFRNIFQKQMGLLIGAALVPWIVNILYQIVTNLFPKLYLHIDLTPITFTISSGLISMDILRNRLMDLEPIARDVVMEHIPELVFVVDAHDRFLDVNTVAENWLGIPKNEIIGQDPIAVFKPWPQLINRFLLTEETREEVRIPGSPPRTLDVVVTPLYDNISRTLSGRVIVAHDVTERKQLEDKLTLANEELEKNIKEVNSLREKLEELAIRDPLTGMFNRRFLAEALDKEIPKAERERISVGIVMMDVDYFKKFNDTYGHKCGDIVLKGLADFLSKNTRQGDIVCRYGGEEFVILMPNATQQDAYESAERWRDEYSATIFHFDGKDMQATFSAGVASYPLHGSTGESILHAADKALYLSKTNGRNRVTLYNE